MARFFYRRGANRRLRRRVWALSRPLVNYTITAAQGSYTLTGQAATFARTYIVVAAQGSYTLSGQTANTLQGYLVTADQGSYSLTGQAATFSRTYILVAGQGSYSLSGQDAAFSQGYGLIAEQGSYALTGQSATLLQTHILTAAQGSYSLTGQAADLRKGRTLTADFGSYALSGQNVSFGRIYIMPAAQGSYSLTGVSADLSVPAPTPTPEPVTPTVGAGGGPAAQWYRGKYRKEVRRTIESAIRELSDIGKPISSRSRKRKIKRVAREISTALQFDVPLQLQQMPEYNALEPLRLKLLETSLALREAEMVAEMRRQRADELQRLSLEYEATMQKLERDEEEEAIALIMLMAA